MSCVLVLHKRVGGCLFPLYEDTFLSPLSLSPTTTLLLSFYVSPHVFSLVFKYQFSIFLWAGVEPTLADLSYPQGSKRVLRSKNSKATQDWRSPPFHFHSPLSLSLSLSRVVQDYHWLLGPVISGERDPQEAQELHG